MSTHKLATSMLGIPDLPGLLALEDAGFPERERWSSHSWSAELTAQGHRGFAVYQGNQLIGAALVSVVFHDAELMRIVVDPGFRGEGIATGLLDEAITWASEQGATRMLLEVRQGNTSALALYRRAGFDELSQRKDYYGPGTLALVLARSLEPAGTSADAHQGEASGVDGRDNNE